MHELAVTQGILDVALEVASRHGAGRIQAIDLVLGELASIVDDSVQFYFDMLAQGTPAQGAVLRFRRVPAQGTCWECGAQFAVRQPIPAACPVCGAARLLVSGGQEFYVDSIEVDDEDTCRARDPERQ